MRRNFDPANRARLLEQLYDMRLSGLTFDQIAAVPGWPSRPTLRKWLRETPQLAEMARATRVWRTPAQRFRFFPAEAEELLRRVRGGEPIARLLREPHLPQRRALNAWKAANPQFAADLATAKAAADPLHRRRSPRRARADPDDEATQDRIMLAVMRGATLPDLRRDPTLPTAKGLRRLRQADPAFDGALKVALTQGHTRRGHARLQAHCTPALTQTIELAIAEGASLAGLGERPDMPSRSTLYKWVRRHPDFAAAVARACEFRDQFLLDDHALDLADSGDHAQAAAIRKRLGQLNPHPGARRRKAQGR